MFKNPLNVAKIFKILGTENNKYASMNFYDFYV